jgi:predicted Zn-dependent protease
LFKGVSRVGEISNMESMLGLGQDNSLMRFTMGKAFIKHGKFVEAAEQLALALKLEPEYSAAWKLYAQTLIELNQINVAIEAYEQGISVANRKGDLQLADEMKAALQRLQ